MSTKGVTQGKALRISYVGVHKLAAGVALICFSVILAAGIQAGVSIITITYRALLAILAVGLISRVVVSILATYEEIHSGKG